MSYSDEEGTRTTGAPDASDIVLNATSPETTSAVVQVMLDLSAMAAGDSLEVCIKEKVISGGSQVTLHRYTIQNALGADDAGWVSPAVKLKNGWDITLKMTTGVSRSIPWSIRKVT